MNKEMITFGVVLAICGLLYFGSEMDPDDAARQVRLVRRSITQPTRLEPEYEGVHRMQDLSVGRSPDGARRFVDPRERDPFSQPAIGRRLPLPDLAPPEVDRANLAVLSPPPVPDLNWSAWGHHVRSPLPSLPGELRESLGEEVARREQARLAAEESAISAELEPGSGGELAAQTSNGGSDPWEAPEIEELSTRDLETRIADVWETRFGEAAIAKVDWLQRAIEILGEREPTAADTRLWLARAAMDRLDWDAAYQHFREPVLIGVEGKGAGSDDPRVVVRYATLLDAVGLEDDAVTWGLRGLARLRSFGGDSLTAERLWASLVDLLSPAGYDDLLAKARPATPSSREALEASYRLARKRFDLERLRALAEEAAERPNFASLPLVVRLLETLSRTEPEGIAFHDRTRSPALEALDTELETLASDALNLGREGLGLRATLRTLQAIARQRNDRLLEARLRLRGTMAAPQEEQDAIRKQRQTMRQRTVQQLTNVMADLVDACQQPKLDTLPLRSHLAYLYLAAGMRDEAFSQVEAGLRIDPTQAYLRYVQGLLQLQSEDRSGALEALSRLTEAHPKFLDAVFWTAFVSFQDQDHARAKALLDWVVEHDPTFQDARYVNGLASYVRGELDEAEEHLKKVGQSERFAYGAQATLGLVQYEERRLVRDLEPVVDWFANLRKKIEGEDRQHPVLRFVQNVELQIGRGANAREFLDDMDRANPVNLFGWDPPMRVPSVQVNMGRWPAEAIEQPGPYADPEKGCLHFYGKFDEKGVAAFWTDRLVLRPADFLSLEADVMVSQGNDALVGMWVGRATRSEGAAPRADEASFAVGLGFGVDRATDEQGIRTFFNMGGTGVDWSSPDDDTVATWPVGAPLNLRIETRSSREGRGPGQVEIRMLVGGEPVRLNGLEWIPAPQFAQEGRGRAITLVFFARGARDQSADFRVDNIRVRYRK